MYRDITWYYPSRMVAGVLKLGKCYRNCWRLADGRVCVVWKLRVLKGFGGMADG
jgi:hypothetical protein